MWSDYKKTENYIKEAYDKNYKLINESYFDVGITSDSIHQADGNFLQLCVINEQPKNILEIGTWVGNSTYCMASASPHVKIHTVDLGKDNFRIKKRYKQCYERIYRNPNTHSTEFLRTTNEKFDFFFNDANLSDEDTNLIFDKSSSSFVFISHDFYRFEGNKYVFCKGHDAAERMIKTALSKKYSFSIYAPNSKWYRPGLIVDDSNNKSINSGCVMIKFKKSDQNIASNTTLLRSLIEVQRFLRFLKSLPKKILNKIS